jgi:DNA repair exonuclease SbcCD ATPase subunit
VINIKRQQLAVLEERKSAYVDNISSREKNIALLEQGIDDLNREREALQFQTTVLDKTADVLGPRGVQHYIFMTVIRVLEAVANLYLEILADGGIQLRLHEDEEGDKIVKGVVIRGADGEFRERGLSQLSGGQWRYSSCIIHFYYTVMILFLPVGEFL